MLSNEIWGTLICLTSIFVSEIKDLQYPGIDQYDLRELRVSLPKRN